MLKTDVKEDKLTAEESEKRNKLKKTRPYVASKLANISQMEERGEISPIIRLEKSYLCNFQCTHCSAEYYMDRHLTKVKNTHEHRKTMTMDDIRNLSKQADELGISRFVITGGEPLVMKDFDEVVAAIDPNKHYIISDTNGWFLDDKKAKHIKSIGVEKVQLSLDSIIEEKHDNFRNKRGSYKRVMRAIDAALNADLNLLLSTVLIGGAAKTKEFEDLCKFATNKGVGLYVSYAKPTGSCTDHPEFVITKEDADIVRELEKKYNVFTHMTPSYGSYKGCITVKGIITVTSTNEVTPCPYIDFSMGNLRETSLKEILNRGMRNPWIGPHRHDCLIGEDPDFIKRHTEITAKYTHLPVPWGKGFSDEDTLTETISEESQQACDLFNKRFKNEKVIVENKNTLFDHLGRRIVPDELKTKAITSSRYRYTCKQPEVSYSKIYERIVTHLKIHPSISCKEFECKSKAILEKLEKDPETKNILNGPGVPFLIPKMPKLDIGYQLDTIFLPALRQSFEQTYSPYKFINHYNEPLEGKLTVNKESRHKHLLDTIQTENIVGYFFPCITEFSIPACIQQMKSLPKNFLLSGGVDTLTALIGSPDLLIKKNEYAPLLWLAALENKNKTHGHYLEAYGYNLTFNQRPHLNNYSEYWASGLTIF